MEPPVTPDTPTHRGVLRVRDLWLDRSLLGEAESRRRVLAWWRPGSALRALADGWWLSLPSPVRVDTRTLPATALAAAGGRRTSAPGRGAASGVWLWRAGRWHGGAAEALETLDPSVWLDDGLPTEVSRAHPLGEPPAVDLAAPPIAVDLRRRLGFSDAADAALRGLTSGLPAVPGGPGVLDGLRSVLARTLGRTARAGAALAGWSPTARSWLDRLDAAAAAMGMDALLRSAVGAHNAAYLQDLLRRLEGGDWGEAIQRAIPLGGEGGGGDGGLAWLSALKGLSFAGGGGGGRGVGAGPDFYERLRALYQRAFEALDAQGRPREAAYVLSQLLGKVGDAVDYLERKGELRLAAELAEGRDLDPGLQVALWIRAGEEDRALAIAAVRSAFGVAVEHLERRGDGERAAGLRLRWAWREQRAGRVVAAVDIAWPVPAARVLAKAWLHRAVAAGGPGGARALARSLVARPEARTSDLQALETLLRSDTAAARRALVASLQGDDPVVAQAARAAARALLGDWERSADAGDADAARQAATRCADGALVADLPPLPSRPPPAWPAERVHHPVAAGDTGAAELFDAVPLDRGRWLVAVGEAGAWLVDAQGRRLRTFAAPAHRLVASSDHGRVLILGARVDRWRVHQLAWPEHRITRWTDLRADAWCTTCDGSVWFVAEGDRVDALDLHADGLRSLWRVSGLSHPGGRVLALDWEPGHLRVLAACPDPGQVERFQYALPSLQLRERKRAACGAGVSRFATTPAGFVGWGGGAVEAIAGSGVSRMRLDDVVDVVTGGARVAVALPGAVELYEPDGLGFQPRAVVETTGAGRPFGRFVTTPDGEPCWVVGDEVGRLRVVDLRTGGVRVDARVG